MDATELETFLLQVRAIISALQRGDVAHAKQLMRACKLIEKLESGSLPQASEVKAALEEALIHALEADARNQHRALGTYGSHPV